MMNGFIDRFLVGLALLAAFGYAGYALGPRALRRRLTRAIAATLTSLPAFLRLRDTAQRLAASADKASGACGGCDNCGSEPRPHARGTDIAIPIAAIRRARTTLAPAVRTSRQE